MIRVEIDDRAVLQALAELQRRTADLTPAMQDIGQGLVEGIRRRIRAGRDWRGRPFAPNAPSTVARKGRNSPLVDSGRMADLSLHYAAGRDHVEVGSSAIQSALLHYGARRAQFGRTRRGRPIPWGDIPARPFMPMTVDGRLPDAARDLVLAAIADHIADLGL